MKILKLFYFFNIFPLFLHPMLASPLQKFNESNVSNESSKTNKTNKTNKMEWKGFDQIAGYTEVKKELVMMAHFMTHREEYEQWNVRLPGGILFHGPPGTGKTLMAKCFAEYLSHQLGYNMTFLVSSGSDFQEKYVGVGSARIRDLFALARKKSPSIIFIDEIDGIGRKRSTEDSIAGKERDTTLNALLVEMDGFYSKSYPVLIIGSTNRKELLDPALLRPGRFDKHLHVPLPSFDTRMEILLFHAQNKPFSSSLSSILSRIAKITKGFSGAELENVLNEATLHDIRQGTLPLSYEDLERVVRQIQYGSSSFQDDYQQEKILQNTPSDTLYAIAVHELGHLYTSFYCPDYPPAVEVSITRPTPSTLGYTRFEYNEKEGRVLESVSELFQEIRVLMGGRGAEYLVLGSWNMTTGASGDWRRIEQLFHHILTTFGFSFSWNKQGQKCKDDYQQCPEEENNLSVGTDIPFLLSDKRKDEMGIVLRQLFQQEWQWVLDKLTQNLPLLKIHATQLIKDRTWKQETIQRKKKDLLF